MAIAAMTDPTPAPRTATRRIESKTGGKAIQMSTSREITPSTQPRYQPASSPSVVPARAARTRGDEGDDQRDPRAIDEARKHVSAKVVRAEIVTRLCAREPRRRQGGKHQILVERALGRDPWREQSDHDQRHDKSAANCHLRFGEQRAQTSRGETGPGRREKRGSGGLCHRRARLFGPALKHGAASD